MEWKTRVTELLGCRYPILQGAFHQFGNWEFAASVARAGSHGTITAAVCRTPEGLRDSIRRCQDTVAGSSGTFGVNLSIGLCPDIEQMLEVCIEERVPVETSVFKPDALSARIKAAGLKWIHKAARVKDAVHAQELGADAIILVGLEGAGLKNEEQLPTLTNTIWGRRKISVPLIASGGIGDAHGFLAALAMGADGIMMGSAFSLTEECPTDSRLKEELIQLNPDNPELRQRVMRPSSPGRLNDTNAPSKSGPGKPDWAREVSFAVGVIDRIPTVRELIEGIIQGAEHILDSRGCFQAKAGR